MALPAQFQLGLELTNIVNPISQAMSALGSLAVIDAIKKSGSDFITETKLASLIGRNRIDPVIKFHFREMVAKSDQSVISRYLDIILESGSGPTVQEALKNPALFSMVIQLSGLAFAHEDESLASAIVEAIEKIAQESNSDLGIVPDYVSLLGTIRACQQQTSAFRWAFLYEAVEDKITKALARQLDHHKNKRKVFSGIEDERRCLPIPVLQGLLMWLQSLQRFPEHRLLLLRCDSGISTVVVWCHHILGLALITHIHGTEVCFGDAPYNVIVEKVPREKADVSLMDPADPHEPLFTLQNDPHSIGISYEHRAEAYGYGTKLLQHQGIPSSDWQTRGQWVISYSIGACKAFEKKTQDPSLYYPSSSRIVAAGRILFAFDEKARICSPESASKLGWHADPIMRSLATIIVTFARISEDDLSRCKEIPLNLDVLHLLSRDNVTDIEDVFLSLSKSFEILSSLLLGPHLFHNDYIQPTVLLSAWGWSVFLDSIDAIDPFDVSLNKLRVLRGVPSRRGFRRTRIIDGPCRLSLPILPQVISSRRVRVYLAEGVSAAEKDIILIGHHSDAFLVTQDFNLNIGRNSKYGYGFRELLESSIRSSRLAPCQCSKLEGKLSTPTSEYATSLARKISAVDKVLKENGSEFITEKFSTSSDSYRVFASRDRNIYFVCVSYNPAARWLYLQGLRKHIRPLEHDNGVSNWYVALGSRDTCVDCAVSASERFPPYGIFLL